MQLPPCARCRGNIWYDGEDFVCVQCGFRPAGYDTDLVHNQGEPYEASLSQAVREMVNGICEHLGSYRGLH